jgi:uncharacterized protein (TIRG00374 family)
MLSKNNASNPLNFKLDNSEKHMMLSGELTKKRTLLSFLLGFGLLALFLYYCDLGEVLRTLKKVQPMPLAIAFLLHYVSYFFRGLRWKNVLCKWTLPAGSWTLGAIILIFQFVDCVLPAKVGDLYGAHLMKVNYGLSRSVSLGSIVLWRLLDAFVVILLCGGATLVLFGITVPNLMISLFQWWTVLIVVTVLLGILFLYKSHWLSRHLPERVRTVLSSFGEGVKPDVKTLPGLVASTTVIWLLEAGRFYCVCLSLNISAGIWPAIIITTASAMATAVPFTPAGLGAVEIFMVSVMNLLDFPSGPLLYTVILLDRAVSYWSQMPLGLITMWISGYSGMRLWTSQRIAPQAIRRG